MDSLTQAVLGAAVGEVCLGKRIGNKAIWLGVIGGTIPDLDVIPGQFLDTINRLNIHRGFSHSIMFFLIAAPLLALLFNRIYRKYQIGWTGWTLFWFLVLLTHPLLDCFTTWGTQLFWPLDYRIAWNTIFVVDPLYTLPLLIAVILVLSTKKWLKRRNYIYWGLGLSSLYLTWTVVVKLYQVEEFKEALEAQNITYQQLLVRPTPMNTVLWSGTAETSDHYLVGYRSIFDGAEKIEFRSFPKNHELLLSLRMTYPKINQLLELTQGFFMVECEENNLILTDLRFGEINGWNYPDGNFLFKYSLEEREKLHVEDQRSTPNINGMLLNEFWERIWSL
jgi:inner membrane protein